MARAILQHYNAAIHITMDNTDNSATTPLPPE